MATPKNSSAYRNAGTFLLVAAMLSSTVLSPVRASAFEILGWKFFENAAEESQAVIDPVRYVLSFDAGTTDDDLKNAIEQGSALFVDQQKPVSGTLGLAVKARDDRERILAVLYEKARYGGLVSISINGIDVDQLPPDPELDTTKPVNVDVRVKPGPAFVIGKVTLDGDAARLDPADYGLVSGGPAGSATILVATEKIVLALKDEGRPLAKLTTRSVVADHDTSTVDIVISAEGGPVANTGEVTVDGTKEVDAGFVADYSRLNAGKPYSPQDLRKAAERLRKLGVFSSVTIREAESLAPDGTIPLSIQVSEGKTRYFGVGAQVSSLDGLGVQGYWGHRNLFGKAESLRLEGAIARLGETDDYTNLDYTAALLFSKPGAFGPPTTFNAALSASYLHPDSYEAATFTASSNVAYELTDKDTLTGGGELSWSDTYDAYGHNRYLTGALPISWLRDASDDRLNPTKGYRTSLLAKPSYEFYNSIFFSSFEGSVSAYRSLSPDNGVILAGKLAAGTIAGVNQLEDIPATRRFYAGGGGSVRGFSYQEIAPRNAAGDELGGRSYAFASLEARIAINETIGIVPFVDAVNVASGMAPDFKDIRIGAGIGLRYATPFGPLRLDVAMPVNPYKGGTRYGIYAGIGQSF